MESKEKTKKHSKRYYRKRVELFRLIDKIKLWPSRTANNSRNSRAVRWLRNKWFKGTCGACRVPAWKLDKYSSTLFRRHFGSSLLSEDEQKIYNKK